MRPLGCRYRVQVRAAGDTWRTCYTPRDRDDAFRLAQTLLAERATFTTARWAHVRVLHGEYLVGMWDQASVVAAPPVSVEVRA